MADQQAGAVSLQIGIRKIVMTAGSQENLLHIPQGQRRIGGKNKPGQGRYLGRRSARSVETRRVESIVGKIVRVRRVIETVVAEPVCGKNIGVLRIVIVVAAGRRHQQARARAAIGGDPSVGSDGGDGYNMRIGYVTVIVGIDSHNPQRRTADAVGIGVSTVSAGEYQDRS